MICSIRTTLAACCGLALVLSSAARAADPATTVLLDEAVAAQGGAAVLRATRTVAFDASGYRNMLEQSERPEGPYYVEFLETHDVHDHAGQALRRDVQVRSSPAGAHATTALVAHGVAMQAVGERQRPGGSEEPKQAAEILALAPERVLLTALAAADAHATADVLLHGVPHAVVAFTLDGAAVHLYLSRQTRLPSAVDYAGPAARSGYTLFLGDVMERTEWSYWRLDRSGLRYPMQWDIRVNGMPDRTLMLRALQVNAPLDPARMTVPEAIAAQFRPDAPPRDASAIPLGVKRTEIAPGVVLIEGAWNVTIVDQGDGVVVLEAPIASAYSAQVLAEAAARFPGKPVKAVVTTSDSWPHLAGIREYAARGIAIYALDLSEPIVRRTLAAPYTAHPDAQQRAPRAPDLHLVAGKTVIGSGANRIELYPIRGAASERQMMAWLPGQKLLYGSDPFQRSAAGGYGPAEPVSELVAAADRAHLAVENFYLMHAPVAPFAPLRTVPGSTD